MNLNVAWQVLKCQENKSQDIYRYKGDKHRINSRVHSFLSLSPPKRLNELEISPAGANVDTMFS